MFPKTNKAIIRLGLNLALTYTQRDGAALLCLINQQGKN